MQYVQVENGAILVYFDFYDAPYIGQQIKMR